MLCLCAYSSIKLVTALTVLQRQPYEAQDYIVLVLVTVLVVRAIRLGLALGVVPVVPSSSTAFRPGRHKGAVARCSLYMSHLGPVVVRFPVAALRVFVALGWGMLVATWRVVTRPRTLKGGA